MRKIAGKLVKINISRMSRKSRTEFDDCKFTPPPLKLITIMSLESYNVFRYCFIWWIILAYRYMIEIYTNHNHRSHVLFNVAEQY